jgi:two-component system response regulator QseB
MRILLIEDDPMIGRGVQAALRQEGHAIDWVVDGQLGLAALDDPAYELVILDLGLPKRDGLELLRRLRASDHRHNSVPVLVVTARDAVADRVKGLDAGADDYLVKPFSLDELSARIRALVRRRQARPSPVIVHGELRVDPSKHTAEWRGEPVRLSAREFALLSALLEAPGKPLSRAALEERLYGWGEEVESNAVEVHIHALRRKLDPGLILNLRGVGYYLAEAT